MTSIARVVEHILEKRPFLEDSLIKGIINYAALAEMLKPEVERELKKKVKVSAIMMALRRLSEDLKGSFVSKSVIKFDKSDITIRSDLFEITFLKSKETVENVRSIYNLVDFTRGDFLTVTQGLYEITVIASRKYADKIKKILSTEDVIKSVDNLSSLTIRIPITAIDDMGLFYVVTKALNWANINIAEIVSTLTELTFILKDDDVSDAFNTIKGLVRGG